MKDVGKSEPANIQRETAECGGVTHHSIGDDGSFFLGPLTLHLGPAWGPIEIVEDHIQPREDVHAGPESGSKER